MRGAKNSTTTDPKGSKEKWARVKRAPKAFLHMSEDFYECTL